MRANAISMVYQDPGRALNPSLTIARQVSEAFEAAGARPQMKRSTRTHRDAAARAHRVARARDGQLSASIVGRHAAARGDRDGARLEPRAADSRRTDHRPRRHRRSRSARPRRATARGTRHRGALHQPQPRGDRADVRARRRAVRGQARRGRRDARRVCAAAPSVHGRACCAACRPPGRSKDSERLDTIRGQLPLPGSVTQGCIYADRCRLADDRCRREAPPPYRVDGRARRSDVALPLPRARDRIAPCERRSGLERNRRSIEAQCRRRSRCCARRTSRRHSTSAGARCARSTMSRSISRSGETLGPRRRIGQRQDDARQADARPALTRRRQRARTRRRTALPARVTRRNDEQVKSLQIVFQNPDSALNRAHSVRRLIGRALSRLAALRGPAKDERLATLDGSRALARALSRLAHAAVVGRAQTARRDCPRVRGRAARGGLRRTDVRARRLRAGRDPQPARRSATRARRELRVHLARSACGALSVGSHRGALSRPAAGDRTAPPQCSTDRIIRIPRRCCRRCRRSGRRQARERIRLSGDLPSAASPPSGCVFHTRCPRKLGAICEEQDPPYADAGGGHRIRCHIAVDELRVLQCGGGCAR